MREIKFRCKNKTGNWCFFTALHNGNVNEENFDLETLSEFTGLLDKQGVEIYDGDILNVANGSINGRIGFQKYAVEYRPKGFTLPYFCWDKDGKSDMNWSHYCEVIGNIWENKELLN